MADVKPTWTKPLARRTLEARAEPKQSDAQSRAIQFVHKFAQIAADLAKSGSVEVTQDGVAQ